MERDFPRHLDALEEVFAFVRDFAAAEKIPEDRLFNVDLILEELFTNAVKYGNESRDDLSVGLKRDRGRLVLSLVDRHSRRFDPTAAPEVDVNQPAEDRRIGGLGIHLIRKLSESFTYNYENRIGTITVVLRLEDDDVQH